MNSLDVAAYTKWWNNNERSLSSKCLTILVALSVQHIRKSCYFILNVHVQGYVQSYCVYYNLTHKHKGTQWRGDSSYVEDHYQKVHHAQLLEKCQEIIQVPSIPISPALTAFEHDGGIVHLHVHPYTFHARSLPSQFSSPPSQFSSPHINSWSIGR